MRLPVPYRIDNLEKIKNFEKRYWQVPYRIDNLENSRHWRPTWYFAPYHTDNLKPQNHPKIPFEKIPKIMHNTSNF